MGRRRRLELSGEGGDQSPESPHFICCLVSLWDNTLRGENNAHRVLSPQASQCMLERARNEESFATWAKAVTACDRPMQQPRRHRDAIVESQRHLGDNFESRRHQDGDVVEPRRRHDAHNVDAVVETRKHQDGHVVESRRRQDGEVVETRRRHRRHRKHSYDSRDSRRSVRFAALEIIHEASLDKGIVDNSFAAFPDLSRIQSRMSETPVIVIEKLGRCENSK